MLIARLHQFLTAPVEKPLDQKTIVWFSLSLVFAAFYSLWGLAKAFGTTDIIQKDAREYIFWMQQFVDPTLLPHDLIASYFKSITPQGYAALYHVMANLGVSPLTFSKVLPVVLGLVTTGYCFGVCLQLLPIPAAAFITTLLLNQSLWFRFDLVSATPRAFVYPLFLAFLYYLLCRRWLLVCITIALQGWFYPPFVLLATGLLWVRVWRWPLFPIRLALKPGQIMWFAVLPSLMALLVSLPYAIASAEFGPVVTGAIARGMPELWPGGRHPFFDSDPWKFWLIGTHSGFLPPLLPPLIWAGLGLPFVLRQPSRFPLVRLVRPDPILMQIVFISISFFFAAHALLLKLFFPTRYTGHTLRIVMAIAGGMTLLFVLDAALHFFAGLAKTHPQRGRWGGLVVTVAFGGLLLLSTNVQKPFPVTDYKVGVETALYAFLQTQPKESIIASFSAEVDNLPTFAQRSILVGEEYALPFHLGYYRPLRQRIVDLLQAQYSQDLASVQRFIQTYNISFWLLDRDTFTPDYLRRKHWLQSFQPAFSEAVKRLETGAVPALVSLTNRCSVLEDVHLILLDATCIAHVSPATKREESKP